MNLMRDLKKVGDDVTKTIWKEIDSQGYKAHENLQKTLTSGNVIQLVSRNSGKALEIVTSPVGQLVVDGIGPENPQALHAHWTVIRESNNVIRLHNNYNYLTIINGNTSLMNFPPGTTSGQESRLFYHESQGGIKLESCQEPGRFVGINADGSLKSAVATSRTDKAAEFGVRLIYSPHAPPQQPPKK